MACNCDSKDESHAADCPDECPTTCDTQTYVGTTCGCDQTCGCMTSLAPCGTPFYNHAEGIEESHSRVCLKSHYVTGVTISSSFVMPACNQTAMLTIPNLQLLNIGVYLWHPTYGYLKVVSFDFANSLVEVENECQTSNAAPGTVIPSCTAFTVVDTPIDAIFDCPIDTTEQGAILVCNGNSTAILVPDALGQVPVSIAGGEVEFQTLSIPTLTCTELTLDFTVLIGNVGPYVMTVTSSAAFTAGDIIELEGYAYRFIVNSLPSGVQINATIINGAPGATVLIPDTTKVCISDCCEQINYWQDHPCLWDLTTRMYLNEYDVTTAPLANGHLHAGEAVSTATASMTQTNPLCKSRMAIIDVDFKGQITPIMAAAPGECAGCLMEPKFAYTLGAIGAAPAPVPAALQNYVMPLICWNCAVEGHTFNYTHHVNVMIPAGQEIKASSIVTINYIVGGLAAQVNYADVSSTIKMALVSV